MIRKALLHGFVFFSFVILTACGARATPSAATPTPAPYGGSSGSSGSLPIVLLAVVTLLILVFLTNSLLRRKKTRDNVATGSADRKITVKSPIESQHKPMPAELAVEERSDLKSSTSGHIFVSYRRSDSADIAGRIYDRLTGKFGRNPVFKDVDSIPLGFDFKEYLDAKVSECSVLLAIIGDRWLQASDETGKLRLDDPTDFVRIEIESALARGIPVIPLLVRGASMPSEAKLPGSLKKLVYRNGIPIRSDPDFHRDMDRLISALEKYIQQT